MPGPRAVVDAPRPTPPVVSLVTAASVVQEPDERWIGGFSYDPPSCVRAGIVATCNGGMPSGISDDEDDVAFIPPALVVSDECLSFDRTRNFEQRVRDLLEAATPEGVEREFWTGELATAKSYPNRFLASTDATTIGSGAMEPAAALACLEQALGEGGHGGRGMIHATRKTATAWMEASLLRREGRQLLTAFDTIVVAGVGYPGTAPDGSTPTGGDHYAYATDLVEVRLSRPQFITDESQTLDRSNNVRKVYAYRFFAATFDQCRHYAALVSLAAC